MTITKIDTVISLNPDTNTTVVSREPTHRGYINITAGEQITDGSKSYTVGTVTNNALESNKCPIEAYFDAIERAHNCYFIVADDAMLTTGPKPARTLIEIDSDAIYMLEGKKFKIAPDYNSNYKFQAV